MYEAERGCERNEIETIEFIAILYCRLHEFYVALDYLNKAMNLIKSGLGDESDQIKVYYLMTYVYSLMGDIEKEIECLYKALNLCEAGYGTNDYKVRVCEDLASAYEKTEDYGRALFYYKKAYEICESGDELEQHGIMCLEGIAQILYCRQQYDEALEFYNKALKLCSNAEDRYLFCMGIAFFYQEKGELETAIHFYRKILYAYDDFQLERKVEAAYCLGKIYQERGELDYAKEVLIKALEYYQQILFEPEANVCSSYKELGDWLDTDTLFEIASIYQYMKDFDQSIASYGKVWELYDVINRGIASTEDVARILDSLSAVEYVARILDSLSAVYSAKGDEKKAKEYKEKAERIRIENNSTE